MSKTQGTHRRYAFASRTKALYSGPSLADGIAMPFPAYVFDAYGTIFDIHAAVRTHAHDIGPDWQKLSDLWRMKQLEYTWVRTLTGQYRDFAEITRDSLQTAMAMIGIVDDELETSLADAYSRLEAYPEVASVLAQLRARGARIAILTNGTEEMICQAASASSLGALIDEVISVDPLKLYKTDTRVYSYAAERLRLEPAAISFQSSNRWDIAAGSKFGFRTVWINRRHLPDEYPDMPPARVLTNLHDLPALD